METDLKDIAAQGIEATDKELVIQLADRKVRVPWHRCSKRLAEASADERQDVQLSPGGFGIHWPRLDEDLSIAGLIRDS